MSVLTVIKKIGEKIISIVEWPIKHSAMLGELLVDLEKDAPSTKSALVGFVQQCEALGPDGLEALASKGLDVPEDIKVGADVKNIFTYVKDTLLPTIEKDYADVKAAQVDTSSPDVPPAVGTPVAPPAAASSAPVEGPGLHNIVPA